MNAKNADLKKNGEGYPDPTAYEAIKNIEKEMAKLNWLVKTLHSVSELAGYQIEGRVVLKNIETGKIWR